MQIFVFQFWSLAAFARGKQEFGSNPRSSLYDFWVSIKSRIESNKFYSTFPSFFLLPYLWYISLSRVIWAINTALLCYSALEICSVFSFLLDWVIKATICHPPMTFLSYSGYYPSRANVLLVLPYCTVNKAIFRAFYCFCTVCSISSIIAVIVRTYSTVNSTLYSKYPRMATVQWKYYQARHLFPNSLLWETLLSKERKEEKREKSKKITKSDAQFSVAPYLSLSASYPTHMYLLYCARLDTWTAI